MLKIDNLSVAYNKEFPNVITGLSLDLNKGDVLNVLGQNAVGKTTLINCLTRMLLHYSGDIFLQGKEIRSYSIKDYSKLVGMVSASFNAYQNLLVADYLVTGFLNQTAMFARPSRDMIEQAYAVLEQFGKQELFNKQIDQLSSGERQLVMISRVILQNPEIIIVDEPTSNLDVKNQIVVLEQIQKLSELGYTVIITTHNPGHALNLKGKTLLMGHSKYLFGDTQKIIIEKNLTEFYELHTISYDAFGTKCIVFEGFNDSPIKIVL